MGKIAASSANRVVLSKQNLQNHVRQASQYLMIYCSLVYHVWLINLDFPHLSIVCNDAAKRTLMTIEQARHIR